MNSRLRYKPHPKVALTGAIASLLFSPCIHAANKTWDGGGANDNWLTGANWDLDTAPASNDVLFFGGSARLAPFNDFAAGSLFNGITFNAGAGAFTLSGLNGIKLTPGLAGANGTVVGGNITNNSTSNETIKVPVTLVAGNHTFVTAASSGTLSIGDSTVAGGSFFRGPNATAVFTRNGGNINFSGSGLVNDASGILGGWALIGNDFAALDASGNIAGYGTGAAGVGSYTPIAAGEIVSGATLNYKYTGETAGITAADGTVINSLVATISAARALTITGTMKLGSKGGIYRTGASTANSVMTVAGGTLTADGGGEITLACATNTPANFAATNNNLAINSVIANDGANPVSVNIVGYVVLNAVNTFTGGTFINHALQASNASAFGPAGSNVTILPGAEAFLNATNIFSANFNVQGIGTTEANGGITGPVSSG